MWRRDLEDLIRAGEHRARRVRDAAGEETLAWLRGHLPKLRRAPPPPPPVSSAAWIVPAVAAAAGAGAALWWWTQWARGRAEAQSREQLGAAGGAAGKAHPEQVMAHGPEPSDAPRDVADPSATELSVPAEDVMAHGPPPGTAAPPKRRGASKPARASVVDPALMSSAAPVGVGDAAAHLSLDAQPSTLEQALGGGRGGGRPLV